MNTLDVRAIPLDLIDVSDDRARSFSIETAQVLSKTIQAQGLMHPIRVLPTGDRYLLISGRHRLEAFRINEAETIPATVSTADSPEAARTEEVMENLARQGFHLQLPPSQAVDPLSEDWGTDA